jgi:hypothetical protein
MYCAGVVTFDGGFMDSSSSERSEGSAIVYLNTSVFYDQGKVVNKILFLSLGWAEDRSRRRNGSFRLWSTARGGSATLLVIAIFDWHAEFMGS